MTGQHDRSSRRYTVHEAALLLGLSVDAVRKRAERGRLKKEKAADGTVYILLDIGQTPQATEDAKTRTTSEETATSQDALIESLRDQIDHLRRELDVRNDELRRKDHLLAVILERIPELEASAEQRELSETATAESGRAQDAGRVDGGREGHEATARRSWFVRFFFGP
jgi:flagellar motility protein MotE (MotC chaperone)